MQAKEESFGTVIVSFEGQLGAQALVPSYLIQHYSSVVVELFVECG